VIAMPTLAELPTPSVVVSSTVLDRNLADMAERCRHHGVRLRPHIKTHNLPEITHRQVHADAEGVTVATPIEAALAARYGVGDIFVAREVVDAVDLDALLDVGRSARLAVAVDSAVGAEALSRAAAKHGLTVAVRLEVDVGGNRCGLRTSDELAALAQRVQGLPGLRFAGLFTHEGHVYGAADRADLARLATEAVHVLAAHAEALRQQGLAVAEVSVGSSPSAKTAADFHGITEVRPGNYAFNDGMQVANGTAALADCALTVIATVISRPLPDRAILNVGSKLLGSDRGRNVSDTGGYGWIVEPERQVLSRLYEEHGVVDAPNHLRIGQRVRLVPSHACMVANLARSVVLANDAGEVLETWVNRRYA
jgi:D-serine deaminase-like pyridoxal phosphate-dependent protein